MDNCFYCCFNGFIYFKISVLDALNVKQPDTIEALSIPAQQIARVVVEEKELTDEQKVLLNNIVDVEKIPEVYSSYISDPIKNLIREKSNQEYLRRHKSAFINLYIQLGLKYTIEYIQACVDQTRGYWNAGYSYWRWTTGVADNEFGITRIIFSERMDSLRKEYMNLWEKSLILQIFLCIGVYVWIILILTCRTVIKKNREAFFVNSFFGTDFFINDSYTGFCRIPVCICNFLWYTIYSCYSNICDLKKIYISGYKSRKIFRISRC